MSEMSRLIQDYRRRQLSTAEQNRLALLLAQDSVERHVGGLKKAIRARLSKPIQIVRLP